MMESQPVFLSEEDYLWILELIKKLYGCETFDSLKEAFEKEVLPFLMAQAGLFAYLEPAITDCQVFETINIPKSSVESIQEFIPHNQLSIMASVSHRSVVAYGVDRDRNELDVEISDFIKTNPGCEIKNLSYLHKLSSVIVAIDRPDTGVGVGIHRLQPCDQPFTIREVRIVELLRPHLCNTIRTLVLSKQLAQYKSLADETLYNSSSVVALINKNFWIVYGNKMFKDLFHLQPGQSLPRDLVELLKKEIAQQTSCNVDYSQVELAFYTLPQGRFRLSVTVLKGIEEDCSLLLRLYPVVESYAKMNLLMQIAGLTSREMEICILVKDGIADQEIASRLFISLHTVKNHVKNIHKKLNVNTRAQLVALLNREGKAE